MNPIQSLEQTQPLNRSAITPLTTITQDVNAALKSFFDSKISDAAEVGDSYVELWEACSRLMLGGGKRLRPYLTVLIYEGLGGKDYPSILPVAISQELLHMSLLIHDDIIDHDLIRYGQDNVAGTFLKKYSKQTSDPTVARHFANGAAILAGDLLLSAAHYWLMQGEFSEQSKLAAMEYFQRGIFEVAGGELLDSESALLGADMVDSLKIARYKTSSYSFIAPLCIGSLMSGADTASTLTLKSLGEQIGIAYQLVDDMLGLYGDEKLVGKPLFSDLREGKHTYLLQYTFMHVSDADKKFILENTGNPEASHDDLARIMELTLKSGAKEHVEKMVADYQDCSIAALEQLPLSPEAYQQLRSFIEHALRRDK